MNRNSKISFFLGLFSLILQGCGDPSAKEGESYPKIRANQTSINELSTLVKVHPEFSKATLKEIKDISNKATTIKGVHFSTSSHYPIDNATIPMAPEVLKKSEEREIAKNLNPEVAGKAQDLIDKILEDFDFKAQFDMAIKILGIYLNMENGLMEKVKSELSSDNFSGKGDHMFEKFDDAQFTNALTCNDLVNNPFIKISKEELNRVITLNKDKIKTTLSGCAHISSEQFLQCNKDINELTTIINNYATCEVQSFEELDRKIEKDLGAKFKELDRSAQDCMVKHFAGCGFNEEEVPEMKIPNKAH